VRSMVLPLIDKHVSFDFVRTQLKDHYSGDGHFPASYSHSQRQRDLDGAAAAAPQPRREATGCGRDTGSGCIRIAGGAGAWSERQPAVFLAPALPGGRTGGAGARGEVFAGSSERELANARRGGAYLHRYSEAAVRNDSP